MMHKLATKTTKLTLIRHTKVQDPTVCYGQLDVLLDEEDFQNSVQNLRTSIGEIPNIYSSPSKRCLDLANALCKKVIVVDELLEMNFGDWQGLNWSNIPKKDIDLWAEDVEFYQFPKGESCHNFFKRAKKGLDSLPSNAIVITHAGIIRASQYWYANANFEQASQFEVEHGQSYEIYIQPTSQIGT